MTLTKTQKTRYTNSAPAKSGVRIGVRFNTSDIGTLKNHCVFFHVDKYSRLSTSKKRVFMMGCIGVSQDTPFLVYGTPIQCNSSPNRLASFGDDYLNHLHKGIIMSNVSIFNFENQSITTATSNDGEIFFHASELATALGFGNPRQAIANHVDKEDVLKLDALTQGGKQKVNFVNESGMYALIFGSTKPEAKRFKKWVTSEVLPTIRKTGNYQSQNQELYQICSGSLNYLMDYVKTLHNLNIVAHSDVLHHQKQFVIQQIHAIIAYCHENNITTPTGKPIFANGELNFIGGNSVVYNLPMLRLMNLVNH